MIRIELKEAHARLLEERGSLPIAQDADGRFIIELELELIEAMLRKAEDEGRELAEVLVDYLITTPDLPS
ncbi:MAG: hypothetical protein WEE64_09905 [Dehalococcoidia bacterium]